MNKSFRTKALAGLLVPVLQRREVALAQVRGERMVDMILFGIIEFFICGFMRSAYCGVNNLSWNGGVWC